eukprot:TRINITY_DN2831_c0_g1_i2.p1 TRINITY_DN2831_c0_g1~~TRINITY_DN2831_c0_g1_i2.p1  ORF type:complete len:521 (+),score=124.29 TRINITY_DN2831_c0_g1_i2:69-1631(+)
MQWAHGLCGNSASEVEPESAAELDIAASSGRSRSRPKREDLEREANEHRQRADNFQREAEQLREDQAMLEVQRQSLEEELERMRRMQDVVGPTEAEFQLLQTELKEANLERQLLVSEVKELKAVVVLKEEELNLLREEAATSMSCSAKADREAELVKRLDEAERLLQEQHAYLEESEMKVEQLTSENLALTAEHSEGDTARLGSGVNELSELVKLREQVAQLTSENLALTAEHSEGDVAMLRSQVDELSELVKRREQEKASLEQEKDGLHVGDGSMIMPEELSLLGRKLFSLEQENEKLQRALQQRLVEARHIRESDAPASSDMPLSFSNGETLAGGSSPLRHHSHAASGIDQAGSAYCSTSPRREPRLVSSTGLASMQPPRQSTSDCQPVPCVSTPGDQASQGSHSWQPVFTAQIDQTRQADRRASPTQRVHHDHSNQFTNPVLAVPWNDSSRQVVQQVLLQRTEPSQVDKRTSTHQTLQPHTNGRMLPSVGTVQGFGPGGIAPQAVHKPALLYRIQKT